MKDSTGLLKELVQNSVSFYDAEALPRVLSDVEEDHWSFVDEAIEDFTGSYDDDEESPDEDDEDEPMFP